MSKQPPPDPLPLEVISMKEIEDLVELGRRMSPGPYQLCGTARTKKATCQCGQIWSTTADKLLLTVAGPRNGDESGESEECHPDEKQFVTNSQAVEIILNKAAVLTSTAIAFYQLLEKYKMLRKTLRETLPTILTSYLMSEMKITEVPYADKPKKRTATKPTKKVVKRGKAK